MNLPPNKQSAFTLVELLVVIVIIAILAAIILPVTGKMRASANRSTVITNLRAIQTGNILYANENNGQYVPVWENTATSTRFQWYADYRFTRLAFNNPTNQWVLPDKLNDPRVPKLADGTINYPKQYAMNITDIGGGWAVPGPTGYKVLDIATPSRTIFFITASNWLFDTSAANLAKVAFRNDDDKAEVVYFDGSAGLVTKAQLFDTSAANRPLLYPKG